MSCGCADRMRKYVLPSLGFTLQNNEWINDDFPESSLRHIKDEDVDLHHLSLTSRMVMEMSKDKFVTWLRKAWGDTPSLSYEVAMKESAERYGNDKQWLESLFPTERLERFIKKYVLTKIGYTEQQSDVWLSLTNPPYLPSEFRGEHIVMLYPYILLLLIETMGTSSALQYWNSVCPPSLVLTKEHIQDVGQSFKE